MNTLQQFTSPAFGTIRTTEIEGEPWFVGKDVAVALGYINPRKALTDHVDAEDKGVTKRDTLGGAQEMTVINESGLYALVLSSKLPGARQFKRWVTSEVLPSIRRTGTDYNMPTQRAMELGLFTIKETAITRSDGSTSVTKTVKVTGKGQQYFIQKFLAA